MSFKRITSLIGMLFCALPAFSLQSTIVCKIDFSKNWYASEVQQKFPDFGMLVYQIDSSKKLVTQTFGEYSDAPLSVLEWTDVFIKFEQPNPITGVGDKDYTGYRRTTINRLSGNFSTQRIYKDQLGNTLSGSELEELIKQKGLGHPLLRPPTQSDIGTCEAKKQSF